MEKKGFHELAPLVPAEKLDPEVGKVLDAIVKVAATAKGAREPPRRVRREERLETAGALTPVSVRNSSSSARSLVSIGYVINGDEAQWLQRGAFRPELG
jgi:hypothetical protein